MSRPRSYKVEALVLRRTRWGEADLLLTLFTPNLGKLRAVARGAARPTSKLGGHLDMLTRTSLLLVQGSGLDVVTQAHTIHSFLPLRHRLETISQGIYLAELVNRFLPERLEQPAVYSLLLQALHRLAVAEAEAVARHFEAQLLGLLGYRPELYRCLGCRAELTRGVFAPARGGVLCPTCRSQEAVVRPVSPQCLHALRRLVATELAAGEELPPEVADELRGLLRSYITYLLEGDVPSARFLDGLRRTPAGVAR